MAAEIPGTLVSAMKLEMALSIFDCFSVERFPL
jgi:hypothetical protein